MTHRAGEADKVWFRSERIIRENTEFFILMRQGKLMGPFETHQDAEAELMLMMRQIQNHNHTQGH